PSAPCRGDLGPHAAEATGPEAEAHQAHGERVSKLRLFASSRFPPSPALRFTSACVLVTILLSAETPWPSPPVKPRKRIDRFDGISEDELSKKILPDHLGPNLDIVIIGINPGLFAAYKGHHYAGPGNHFWKCLFLSGLIPEPLTSDDDHQLLDHGIGFTNIVARTTRGSSDLTRKEIKEGGQILLAKLQRFQPRVAVFNGKGIYEIFSGKKEFTFGRQPEKIEGTHTHVWVMPSSSARCAQLPRALDKVPFYTALRKFRDFLKGTIAQLTEEEITFSCPKSHKHLKDLDKLEGTFEDDLPDTFLDETLKDDLESTRFETELDSEEISRSISQSLFNLSGMTREQLEALDCPTIPIRKKRGRPKKAPEDPNAPPRPKPSKTFPTELLLCNGEEPPRKKRGRPKKVLEDGSTPPPKRPGRKPKALKEMLATQQGAIGAPGIHPGQHAQMGMGHINGMMSPSGYNSNAGGPPFSPQFGGQQVHPMNGPSHPGDLMPSVHGGANPNNPGHNINNHPSLTGPHNPMHGGLHSALHSGGASLHPPGCPTPNSNSGGPLTPGHNSLPQRGPTPQGFGQSPGYSPSPVPSHLHHLGSGYNHLSDKSELQLEEERHLGLSPLPSSPGMAQPDFEPPTSLAEGGEGPLLAPALDDSSQQPSLQSQFSSPSTPADDSNAPYPSYPPYPGSAPACSPSYNHGGGVVPSPSYPPPSGVSCSPSYAPHNTHSPSFPPKATQSPSPFPRSNAAPSPSPYPAPPNPPARSPYQDSLTQSTTPPPPPNHRPPIPQDRTHPTYMPNPTRAHQSLPRLTSAITDASPLLLHPLSSSSSTYRPPTSHSPSFPPSAAPANHSPALHKPLAPGGGHSPQMKTDVSSKSLSGLESLVDQIPSLSETEAGGPVGGPLPNGPCSNPTTPGPPSVDPFSPGHGPPHSSSSSFQSFAGGGGGGPPFPPSHYGSPQAPPGNPYSPQYTSSTTNLSTNFSVSSLANSSSSSSSLAPSGSPYEAPNTTTTPSSGISTSSSSSSVSSSSSGAPPAVSSTSSSSFSVSSLTGGSPTPTPSMYNAYSPAAPGPSPQSYDIMGSSILPPTPPMGPSFMGASGMSGSMGSALPSSMNMSGSQLPYPYSQYPESGPGGYNGPSHASFPYSSSSPGFHVPSPRFPYPYSGGPYSQGYSQNAVLERIKQTGMGMGFGGF
ncbi:UNVERIFIED_CONTAM: hypothetical protein GTU68_066590, partial [Idotea baltica]|nr:hypothetical protein [Idotea baltica]